MPMKKSEFVSEVWKDDLFKGKVVFCTGGSGTICSAQVRAMVHLGANACIVGRQVEKTEKMAKDLETARSGSRVLGIGTVDVRNPVSLGEAIDTCVRELGGIDFLIVGAAGNFLAPISKLSPNAFKTVVDIDVLGSYNTVKLALPHIVASAKKHNRTIGQPKDGASPASKVSSGGRVIFVSATMHYIGMPLQTHAAVAKAGVDAMSNQVAIEYGPVGVTSNVISPGIVGESDAMARLGNTDVPGAVDKARNVPMGRWASVKDIADATVYLFSDAGNYVNGDTLIVDGGAWHRSNTSPGSELPYPDFIISGAELPGTPRYTREKKSSL